MKHFLQLVILLISISISAQKSYLNSQGDQNLLGIIEISDLEQEPYKDWFERSIEMSYKTKSAKNLASLKVEIFIGTWCGDSRQWLPEFMKFWKDNNLPIANLKLVALHNEDDQYKRSPSGEEVGLNIHRVPTFIFYDEGLEVARIVESPVNDLKTDLLQIANGFASKPRYRAVGLLDEAMAETPIDSLYAKNNYRPLLQKVYKEVCKPSELNTYGYVLKARGDIRKAEFVFYMNRNLFKWDPNTWDSLGETYFEEEKYEEAKFNYQKVLELKPDNENAVEMLAKIEKALK